MLKKLLTKAIIISAMFIAVGWAHPFHVSIVTFKLNPKSNMIEITMKFFADDLENAIRIKNSPKIRLGAKNDSAKTDTLIVHYLQKHIQLTMDGQKKTMQWVGKEIENDIAWCYLEIKEVTGFSSAWIKNSILISEFDDQLNISHFQKGNNIETIMNHKDKLSGKISFKSP